MMMERSKAKAKCYCERILENYEPLSLECCYSTLYFCLGNILATSSENERLNYINIYRHIMHNTWAYSFCLDNGWEYTNDVSLPGTNYTPDRIMHDNQLTIIYDYTVTTNVDRSYTSKNAKYKDHCDSFILLPYILNGSTSQYIESLNLNFGANCDKFSKFIESVMSYSQYWITATDDFDDSFPNVWEPGFESRNSMVRIQYPEISPQIKEKWHDLIGAQDENSLYLIKSNSKHTNLIFTLSDAGKKPSDWMNMFENHWNSFLFNVTKGLVIETTQDDDLIYTPISSILIHEAIRPNYHEYMSRSIVCSDTVHLSPAEVNSRLIMDDHQLLTMRRCDPIIMLNERINFLKSKGIFHKKELFMLPVAGSVKIQEFNYNGIKLRYNPKQIEGGQTLQKVSDGYLDILNRNSKIMSLRKEMSKLEQETLEMYDILRDPEKSTPTTNNGNMLKTLIIEQHSKKIKQISRERKMYKNNMFKSTDDIKAEIDFELNRHEEEINLLNSSGGDYIFNTITSVVNYLTLQHGNDFILYQIPVASQGNDWWNLVHQWDDHCNFYISELSKYNIAYVISDLSNLVKSIIAMSDYKVEDKRAIFYDIPVHSRWCLLVSNDSKGLSAGSSKPFSIITSKIGLDWYNYDTGRNQITENTIRYHWRYIKVDQLYYYANILEHVCSTYSCMRLEKVIATPADDLFIKALLVMLDGRRKTEVFLHDMKYLIFNLMGTYTDFSELIEDKFIQPNNVVLAYFELLLANNSYKYIESVKANERSLTNTTTYNSNWLYHPLSDGPCNLDRFSFYNYLSYASIKGVFTKTMEDNVNLSGIVKNHKEWVKLNCSNNYFSIRAAMNEPTNRDNMLYYDHDVLMAVSEYILEHFRMTNTINLQYKWHEYNNMPLAMIATSSGMRCQDFVKEGKLVGNGHMMIMKYLSQNWEEVNPQIVPKDFKTDKSNLISSDITLCKYTERNYKDLECLFTFSNKKQWGGSREIYIQTMEMKSIQFRLEKLLSDLCKSLDNELIHIPSNKRTAYIYNRIKTPFKGKRYYLTLDCKRWAPLSNMAKFIDLINSWANYLPKSFVNLFNFYLNKYFSKKLIISKDQYQELQRTDKQAADFFREEQSGCYSLLMPESFMMGMFNYLSSFLHASVQKYFIDNILPIIEDKNNVKLEMTMFAHSDDSGGWIEISGTHNESVQLRVLKEVIDKYQSLLSLTNHHLSTKKCVISEFYFEIISIIFICTDIMPVMAKNIYSFNPSAEKSGPINDLISSNSGMFDLISNGSSLETAYNKRAHICHAILKGCGYKDEMMTKAVTVRLGGFPTSHPLFQFLFGAFAEEAFWYARDRKMVNESLVVSGQGYSQKLMNYINPDPKYYSKIKEVNKYFIKIQGNSLIDITDREPIKTNYQYMIKMKSISGTGNLNKIFGQILDTPLNFLKRMNMYKQYYDIKGNTVSMDKLPVVWSSYSNNLDECSMSDFLDQISEMQLPRVEDLVQDSTRIKPIKMQVNDSDPIRWIKRLQLLKLWYNTNYKYYLSVVDYPTHKILLDLPMDSSVFSQISLTEGLNELQYDFITRPLESREVNTVDDIINLMLNNNEKGVGLDRRSKVKTKTIKDDMTSFIREIIYNKVSDKQANSLTINNLTLKDWLIKSANVSNVSSLPNPVLYRLGNQKHLLGTYEWAGKIQLIISYQGQSVVLEVRNGIVISAITDIKGKKAIELLLNWLPESGYRFPIKLGYNRGNSPGFYLDRFGNYYYSDFSSGDPMIQNLYYKPNVIRLPSHVNWVWGSYKYKNRSYNYELLSKFITDSDLVIKLKGKRLPYDPFGNSRILKLPNTFNLGNMSSWYTSTKLYHSFYNSKDKDPKSDPKIMTISYYTMRDDNYVKNYMANEVTMKEQDDNETVLRALNTTITSYHDGRMLRVRQVTDDKSKTETRMVSIQDYKNRYYMLCGRPTLDRDCLQCNKGGPLYDFLSECSCKDLDLQILYSEYKALMVPLIKSSWRHTCSWPTLYKYCNIITSGTTNEAFKDPVRAYILMKNLLFIAEKIDTISTRELKRNWIRGVYRVFKSIDHSIIDDTRGLYYYPMNLPPSFGFMPSLNDLMDFLEVQDSIEYRLDEYMEEEELDENDPLVMNYSIYLYSRFCQDGNYINHLDDLDPNDNLYNSGIRIDPRDDVYTSFWDKHCFVDHFGSVLPYSENTGENLIKSIKNHTANKELFNEVEPLIVYVMSLYRLGRMTRQQVLALAEMMDKPQIEDAITKEHSLMSCLLTDNYDSSFYNSALKTVRAINPCTNSYSVINGMYSYSANEHDSMMLAELNAISPSFVKWWLTNSLCLTSDQINTWKLTFRMTSSEVLRPEIKDLVMKMISECRISEPSSLTSQCNNEFNKIISANTVLIDSLTNLPAPQQLISSDLYT